MSDNDNNYPTVHTDKPVYDLGFDRGYSKARAEVIEEIKQILKSKQELGHAMESDKLAGVVRMSVIFEELNKLSRGAE